MAKTLYCAGCFVKVAIIKSGSKIKAEATMLCGKCELKRKASDLANKTIPNNPFEDVLKNMNRSPWK